MRPRHIAPTALLALLAMGVNAQDTVRVRADNAPLWGATPSLTKVFSIGGLDGPPEYAFASVDLFAERGDGTFAVYDGQDVQLRLYDQNGKFIRNLGRRGSGPGEYQRLVGVAVSAGGTLGVLDPNLRRLSFFDRNGVFMNSVAVPFAIETPQPFAVDSAGRMYIRTIVGTRIEAKVPENLYGYVRLARDGRVIDTIPIAPRAAPTGVANILTSEGERPSFAVSTVTAPVRTGGVVSGRGDRYVLALTMRGKPTLVERNHRPVALRAEERAEWEQFIRDLNASRANSGRGVQITTPLPATKPVFRGLIGDHDGRIWVELYGDATKHDPWEFAPNATIRSQVTWRDPGTYDVIGSDGRYFGRIVLPPHSVFLGARADLLWVRTLGANDEPMVVLYRISGTP